MASEVPPKAARGRGGALFDLSERLTLVREEQLHFMKIVHRTELTKNMGTVPVEGLKISNRRKRAKG